MRTWLVGVDKRRFERVMVNLMENADHYGGGVTGIQVRPGAGNSNDAAPTAGKGDQVEVIVDDEGPGIDPLERTKVFERFYRGSASGRRGTGTGTGLGLALVAEHMHVMHGDVRVESSPAGGARFVLTLPVLPDEDDADGDGVRPRRPAVLGALLVGVAFLAAGCAIPTQSAPSTMPPSKVPFDLLDPHLPTTTTTQPKPSSLVPVKVFFLNATSQLTSAPRVVAAPAPLTAIITSMLAGPTRTETTSQGLTTAIPSNVAVISATHLGGHRHREHERRLRLDHREQHRTGGGADRRHRHRRRRGTTPGVVFEVEGERTSVPIANGSQVNGPVYILEFL